ncbi:calpastatin-like isoform X4 [Carassius auratus]|uniref:Calpastatin n=1 Tax=Carassius auratus TaxID=7957 RepID=A0A6P6M0E4_CARAU|nr:calpastatin-like isoform X4 [Carassius auratus]XP_026090148.1 calpastatin-like isoform X4 [Carassius auratus]XP_026090149.1 calpastatin-like isoform X4 [Carassius auratus]
MPHRKRCHGRKKNNKETGDNSLQKANVPQTSRFQSQQVTPTPASQVSTANPAKHEKGPTQPSTAVTVKPGTTPATPAAPSGASGGGGFTTTQKGPSQVTPQATVSKPTPAPSAKDPAVSSGTGHAGMTGVKATDPLKDKAQSTTVPSSKPGPAKVDPAVGKPSAPASVQKQTSAQKVQVEVGPPGAKVSSEDVDPFDALSGTLPSSQPVAPKVPAFTGPEVKEPNVKAEKGVICGERDDTLPPGYRRADLEKKTPAGVPEKPKDVPKPISTDEAMDSLSAGFVSSVPAAPKKTDVKTETVGAVDVRQAGISNFAPPPPSQKQMETSQPAAVTKSSAPPADKKARIETPAQPTKPKTDQADNSMSLDALSALGDTLGAPEPPKKSPELKPEQIVDEKKWTSEKGVRVGEREDTLPPGYRFSEEELMKYPPPEKEPSLDTDDALDILSGGFTEPVAAPVVKAAVPPAQEKKKPEAVPEKAKDAPKETKKPAGVPEKSKDVPKPKVDELSALDALASDFVAPAQSAPKVSSCAPNIVPPGPKQKPQTDEDALSALGDTLGKPEPPKKEPELKPRDIVHEKDLTSKTGVRVGEREDTLPPGYRFSEEKLKTYPPPEKEPSLDANEAMDILSGDFTSPSAASSAKTPVCPPSKSPAKPSDSALDALAGDFVAPSSASKVQSAVSGPQHAGRQLSEGTSSALDALSDTLADFKAAPEPAPVPPKDVVKEKNIVEERMNKPGEREDTLPPDYRFTEEDRKAFEAAKQKDVKPKPTSIDDSTALDMLSSDFSAVAPVKPSAPEAKHFTPEPQPPTFKASGPVFDELAEKMIPNLTDPKAKDSKPKKQSVEDPSVTEKQPGKMSSDVVPSSSTKGGKR